MSLVQRSPIAATQRSSGTSSGFMLPSSDKLGTVDLKEMVALVRGFQGGKQVVPVEEPKLPGPPAPAIVVAPSDKISIPLTTPQKVGQPLVAPPGETAARIRTGATIFRQFCIVCHGVDGKGTLMRPVLPPIPDFTNPAFHKEHTDAALMVSILDGKGTLMPANRGRVTEDQVGDLVAFVRSFGGPEFQAAAPAAAASDDFEARFNTLQQQWDALEKQLQSLSPAPAKR